MMIRLRHALPLTGLIALALASCICVPVVSTTAAATDSCPAGWLTPANGAAPGYRLCSRSSDAGTTTVQIVDLAAGARVAVVSELASGGGSPEASFVKRDAAGWWVWAQANTASPAGAVQAVVNASFFMEVFPATETALSFAQRRNGVLETIGADPDASHAMAVLGLSADGARATIRPYPVTTRDPAAHAVALSDVDSALVSFAAEGGPVATRRTRRTYVGGRDVDGDGALDRLFVLTTAELLTARDVVSILRQGFESEAAIQFDGGGSTQFHGRAGHMRSAECNLPGRGCRLVPNVLAIYAAR